VLHLLDRLVVLVLAEALETPVLVHARMQEVLVDRGQLDGELLVEELDDLLVAFHVASWGRGKQAVQLRARWQRANGRRSHSLAARWRRAGERRKISTRSFRTMERRHFVGNFSRIQLN